MKSIISKMITLKQIKNKTKLKHKTTFNTTNIPLVSFRDTIFLDNRHEKAIMVKEVAETLASDTNLIERIEEFLYGSGEADITLDNSVIGIENLETQSLPNMTFVLNAITYNFGNAKNYVDAGGILDTCADCPSCCQFTEWTPEWSSCLETCNGSFSYGAPGGITANTCGDIEQQVNNMNVPTGATISYDPADISLTTDQILFVGMESKASDVGGCLCGWLDTNIDMNSYLDELQDLGGPYDASYGACDLILLNPYLSYTGRTCTPQRTYFNLQWISGGLGQFFSPATGSISSDDKGSDTPKTHHDGIYSPRVGARHFGYSWNLANIYNIFNFTRKSISGFSTVTLDIRYISESHYGVGSYSINVIDSEYDDGRTKNIIGRLLPIPYLNSLIPQLVKGQVTIGGCNDVGITLDVEKFNVNAELKYSVSQLNEKLNPYCH